MSQLSCNHLTLGYDGNVVLSDLSFHINKGDYLCIIGSNGTGKTTLMNAILGLKKPISGEIIWGDGLQTNEIGYLTQQSQVQKEFPASVTEVVLSGFQNRSGFHPFYSKQQKQTAKNIMQRLGIEDLAKRCYRELSGGQQQRVMLSRALCATQKILFLDEPVTGLDPEVSKQMYQTFHKLNQEDLVSIIMISHDVKTAMEYASHILQIGEQSFFGTKQEFLEHRAKQICICKEVSDCD